MPIEISSDEEIHLQSKLEALLFVATSSITIGQLSAALDIPSHDIEIALEQLELHYKETDHGLRIQHYRGRVQLTTSPELAPIIERYLGLEVPSRLSRAALETLAIIAYQQPATRPEIDSIRGVNSDGVLRTLLGKGLIEEVGRAERPGRPILFITSADFLQYFGLTSLNDLPPLELDTQQDQPTNHKDVLIDHPLINNLKG